MQGMGKGNDMPQAWAVLNMEHVTVWLITSLLHGAPTCQSQLLRPAPKCRHNTQGIKSATSSPEIRFLLRCLFLAGIASEMEKCPH